MHKGGSHREESTLKPGFQSIRINIYSPYVYQAIKNFELYYNSSSTVKE